MTLARVFPIFRTGPIVIGSLWRILSLDDDAAAKEITQVILDPLVVRPRQPAEDRLGVFREHRRHAVLDDLPVI